MEGEIQWERLGERLATKGRPGRGLRGRLRQDLSAVGSLTQPALEAGPSLDFLCP